MQLSAKPDFERAKEMWNHYWAGEVLKRPLVVARVEKKGGVNQQLRAKKYYNAIKRE